ncbi:hypothetical protein DPMN_145180 [Dreissena polymorpha]|uniref:Uncharacterized protein n=1 Tax=Dreissena polymorpha TaxID=45954 RepID=A0A9D4IX89_DREPO|nr:hypothetical protein DPMN_145180 [Dreissena polymorpha]
MKINNKYFFPAQYACQLMDAATFPVDGLAVAAGLFYNGTNGQLKCYDIKTEFVACADQTGCGVGPDSLAWDFQVPRVYCYICLWEILA